MSVGWNLWMKCKSYAKVKWCTCRTNGRMSGWLVVLEITLDDILEICFEIVFVGRIVNILSPDLPRLFILVGAVQSSELKTVGWVQRFEPSGGEGTNWLKKWKSVFFSSTTNEPYSLFYDIWEEWRERVRDIRATSAIWWWWWHK